MADLRFTRVLGPLVGSLVYSTEENIRLENEGGEAHTCEGVEGEVELCEVCNTA